MVWHRECVYSRWNESTPFFYRRYLPDYGVPPLRGSASVTSAYDAPPAEGRYRTQILDVRNFSLGTKVV